MFFNTGHKHDGKFAHNFKLEIYCIYLWHDKNGFCHFSQNKIFSHTMFVI